MQLSQTIYNTIEPCRILKCNQNTLGAGVRRRQDKSGVTKIAFHGSVICASIYCTMVCTRCNIRTDSQPKLNLKQMVHTIISAPPKLLLTTKIIVKIRKKTKLFNLKTNIIMLIIINTHSLIHIEYLYSALSKKLLRGSPKSSAAKKNNLQARTEIY